MKYTKETRQKNSNDAQEYLKREIECLENPVDANHYPNFSIIGRAASLKYEFNIRALNCTLDDIERTDSWNSEREEIPGYPLTYNCPICVIYHHVANKPFTLEGEPNHWLYLEHGEGGASDYAYDGTALSLEKIKQDLDSKKSE